jgi:hypothetical protein
MEVEEDEMTKQLTVSEILDGFGSYSRWYGFDEALLTKGSHTSSTPTEAITSAKQSLKTLVTEMLEEITSGLQTYKFTESSTEKMVSLDEFNECAKAEIERRFL